MAAVFLSTDPRSAALLRGTAARALQIAYAHALEEYVVADWIVRKKDVILQDIALPHLAELDWRDRADVVPDARDDGKRPSRSCGTGRDADRARDARNVTPLLVLRVGAGLALWAVQREARNWHTNR